MEGKKVGKPKGPAYPFGALLFLWLSLALAVTPAGTEIQNQASATYVDSAGQPRTTTSNLVVTVVQKVYGFTITPDGSQNSPGQTRSGLAGSQVLFSYQVTNTGNVTDTITLSTVQGTNGTDDDFDLTNVETFLDNNCNGNLDAGETTSTTVTLAMGASACVIVRGTIPSNPNQTSGNALINLEGTSQGDSTQTDTNNWARATVTAAAVLTAFKSASPSGNVLPGDTITYTVSGSNVGGGPAAGVSVNGLSGTGILISDTIPTGLEVSAAPTGNAGAGTVQIVYSSDGGATWTTTAPNFPIVGNGSNQVGMFINLTNPNDPSNPLTFPVGAQYTFSFQAKVPPTAPVGTSYPNTATVLYNDGTADQTTTSNEITNTAANRYSVAIGGTGATAQDGPDTQTIATAPSGSTVVFSSTLQNTGNAPDSFTLSLGSSTIGTCTILQSDGVTPLSGPVGPLAAGATYNVVVQCAIPAGQTTGGSVKLTAISQGNPNGNVSTPLDGVDETTLQVDNVTPGYAVDAAHNVNNGAGNEGSEPGNDTTSNNPAVNPGGVAYFPFEVKNTGTNPDTYNFTFNAPSGWTVVFYPDDLCDRNMDNPTPAPVTDTGLLSTVPPNNVACFIAAVQVPANAAPVNVTPNTDDNVQFTVTSTTPSAVSDTISGAVDVNLVDQIALAPDRAGTVTSPGTIEYTHTLINNSDADASCNLLGSGSYGWTYQYSTDGSTWAPSLSGINILAGGSKTIYVRVLVPAGQPIGRTDVNTLTATCTVNGQNYSVTATETTTVVGGELRLTKSAVSYVGTSTTVRSPNGTQAYPGDVIEYTVVAENIGTGNLEKVIIIDPLPGYTDFVSVSATHTGFPTGAAVLYSTDGNTWSQSPPNSLSLGQSIYVGVNTTDTDVPNKITDADVMPPGAKITLTFRVQVQ